MAASQVIARDLTIVLNELQTIAKSGRLDPMVAAMLEVMIRLVELQRRQVRHMRSER